MSANSDRNSFDTAASSDTQGNLATVVSHLESVLNTRDAQVKAAMANFKADGVDAEYHAKEMQWKSAAQEVRQIIALVKTLMGKNDSSATAAQSKAKSAVAGMV